MNKKKYLLYLINPKFQYQHYGTQKELGQLLGKKNFIFSLALSIIASLTPKNYKIKIINEEIEKIPYKKKPDLVAITTPFTTKKKCFEIGDKFRAMGIPVIMGGTYATFLTDEVLEHSDCVVIGEAEGVWNEVLNDFENRKLRKIYKAEKPYEFKKIPIPRWDLVKTKNLNFLGVQASRGCPYNCEFCIVPNIFGRKQRYRDVDNVIEEIKSLPIKRIFFVDDNLTFNKAYMHELIAKLKPLHISWVCQSSIEIADDQILLKEMKEAGCFSILIGFESLNPESLKESNKKHNDIELYENAISKIQEIGLQLIASFVIGFDADTTEVFDQIVKFSEKNNILFTMVSTLTVAPGTNLYERIKKENRLLDIEDIFYNGSFPCMKYKNITLIDMYERYYDAIEKIFSIKSMSKKVKYLLNSGAYKINEGFKDIGIIEKFFSSLKLLKLFFFTKDKEKKEFFKEIIQFGIKKIASWDNIAIFLFIMGGFNEYVNSTKKFYNEIKEKIIKIQNELS